MPPDGQSPFDARNCSGFEGKLGNEFVIAVLKWRGSTSLLGMESETRLLQEYTQCSKQMNASDPFSSRISQSISFSDMYLLARWDKIDRGRTPFLTYLAEIESSR